VGGTKKLGQIFFQPKYHTISLKKYLTSNNSSHATSCKNQRNHAKICKIFFILKNEKDKV
jgi:hypothetical protein